MVARVFLLTSRALVLFMLAVVAERRMSALVQPLLVLAGSVGVVTPLLLVGQQLLEHPILVGAAVLFMLELVVRVAPVS
jgi:hypothetical protein